MDNAYTKQRREHILGLLDPSVSSEEQLDALTTFVEDEVREAYRRGLRAGRSGEREGVRGFAPRGGASRSGDGRAVARARETSRGQALRYSSAVQAGLIRRAGEVQEPAP